MTTSDGLERLPRWLPNLYGAAGSPPAGHTGVTTRCVTLRTWFTCAPVLSAVFLPVLLQPVHTITAALPRLFGVHCCRCDHYVAAAAVAFSVPAVRWMRFYLGCLPFTVYRSVAFVEGCGWTVRLVWFWFIAFWLFMRLPLFVLFFLCLYLAMPLLRLGAS